MGSEHYCLRWNNHQSNLLGVFSQLLQDESLVDVTLACSEGASIRAHKVVLSACSTYFQSLFLEHPTRHPIIILKDVRYPELRTLVDFMYKGEVNVQYCQLSALLKTAESLKVKGLAEMTNQNTALRETERDTDRLRPHSATTTKSEPIDTTGNTSLPLKSSTSALSTITSPNRLEPDRCSPTSPPPSSTRLQTLSPIPLDLYQRRNNRDPDHNQLSESPPPPPSLNANDINYPSKEERPSSPDDDTMSNDIGLNMTINSNALHAVSAPPSVVVPPIPTSLPSHPTDLRPSSRGGPNSTTPCSLNTNNNNNNNNNNSSSTSREQLLDSGSRLTMPESLPGPSGMGPVQQVPLSLKKEIDWERHDEKPMSSDGSISEFRHPHETEATDIPGGGQPPDQGGSIIPCMYCGASFTNQTKLTRHILSHSLESLKFRESTHLFVSHLNLPPHELHSQHFPPLRPGPPQMEPLEPPDGGPMDIEYHPNSSTGGGMCSGSISGNMGGGLTPGNSTSCSGDQGSVVLCKFCGKSFPDVSSLITHLPVHTGDRPFKCEYCGKAFKLRHHMKDHCRVHTGERPFRCGMCGKTFSRSTILKAHEKTHYPKYVRKFLSSPSPGDIKDESPQ